MPNRTMPITMPPIMMGSVLCDGVEVVNSQEFVAVVVVDIVIKVGHDDVVVTAVVDIINVGHDDDCG
jgi:hypothetical protein